MQKLPSVPARDKVKLCQKMWEVFKNYLDVVLRDMVQWGNTGDRQTVGLEDLRDLFQPW